MSWEVSNTKDLNQDHEPPAVELILKGDEEHHFVCEILSPKEAEELANRLLLAAAIARLDSRDILY